MSDNTKDTTNVVNVVKEAKASKSQVQKLEDTNSYPMHDFHAEVWKANGNLFDTSTPIAKAWSRLLDRDIQIGPPLGEEYTSVRGPRRQMFTYALAEFDDNEERNPNKAVTFFDARGIVGTESGL